MNKNADYFFRFKIKVDSRKKQYIGGLPKKGAWIVFRFKRGLREKEKVVFLMRVDTPMHTMSNNYYVMKF